MARKFSLALVLKATAIAAAFLMVILRSESPLISAMAIPLFSIGRFPFGPMAFVAFLATAPFYRLARQNGFHPGRAALVPMFLLGLLFAIDHVVANLAAGIMGTDHQNASNLNFVGLFYQVGFLVLYLATLKKMFSALGG